MITVLTYKKEGKRDTNDYRGISLLEYAIRSIRQMSRLLLNRIEEQLESMVGNYQVGFRKGQGSIEEIFTLK